MLCCGDNCNGPNADIEQRKPIADTRKAFDEEPVEMKAPQVQQPALVSKRYEADREPEKEPDKADEASAQEMGAALVGNWAINYSWGSNRYNIAWDGGKLMFKEDLPEGMVVGELVYDGSWYVANLLKNGGSLGSIKLRSVAEGLESQCKPKDAADYTRSIIARRENSAQLAALSSVMTKVPEPPAALTARLDPGAPLGVELLATEWADMPLGTRGALLVKGAPYEADGQHGPWGSARSECAEPPPKICRSNAAGSPGLFPGDAIVAIDGRRCATGEELRAALVASQNRGGLVRFGYRPRPSSFTAEIVRKANLSSRIGLSVLVDKPESEFLTVRMVRDNSMVSEWNTDNPFAMICAGDTIVGVNESSGRAERMLELLKNPAVGAALKVQVKTPERRSE